jgi:hypothetical protein
MRSSWEASRDISSEYQCRQERRTDGRRREKSAGKPADESGKLSQNKGNRRLSTAVVDIAVLMAAEYRGSRASASWRVRIDWEEEEERKEARQEGRKKGRKEGGNGRKIGNEGQS